MLWKFVCDLRFQEVLQTTIIKQITKGNEEIEKIMSQTIGIVYKSSCACVCGL